jgi:hypothetical protein
MYAVGAGTVPGGHQPDPPEPDKNILSKRPAQDEEATQVLQNESGKAEQNRSEHTPASLPERNPAGLISLPANSLPVPREAFHGLPR